MWDVQRSELASFPLPNSDPVLRLINIAQAAKVQVIFVSFETLRNVRKAEVFISAWSQSPTEWQREVTGHLKNEPTQRALPPPYNLSPIRLIPTTGKLLILDSLNTLSTSEPTNLPSLLSSFISPTTSLLAVYHTDIPVPPPSSQADPYAPAPLILLKYLATTIFTTHSVHHVLARKAARERSRIEPSFGLQEGVEGVVQGLGANGSEGVVLEMEHRRKSGRGVREWYYLPLRGAVEVGTGSTARKSRESVDLLEDHPQFRELGSDREGDGGGEVEGAATFELGLTEKQRLDREGVVLPYFDAQKGGGEGGRILYDMGSEDDFDEEEDEI